MGKVGVFDYGMTTHGDEYMTKEADVRMVAEWLKPGLKIWCPFNDVNSYWPPVLREYGHEVWATDTDFFYTMPPLKRPVLSRTRPLR